MKRTTYIIFGMLLTGLVVVCAGIFYASTQVTGWDNIFLDIKGDCSITAVQSYTDGGG
jgi:uncharacterized protein YxeA